MKYRKLGNTGLEVSVLGFGCGAFGGIYGGITDEEATKVVRRAIELGVNFFDTAPFYGKFKSEELLGQALQGIPREKFHVATKVGRFALEYGKQGSHFDYSYQGVIDCVEGSLKRLKLDYIDLIQCHDIEFVPLQQVIDQALPALKHLQSIGKVKFIGITGLPLPMLSYVAHHSQIHIDSILSYCHYTLYDTSFQNYFSAWEAKGLGLINAAALSMGLLSTGGPPDWHPAPAQLKEACKRARDHCQSKNKNISKLATQFSFANSKIATTLVGFKNTNELEEAIGWLEEPMDEVLLAEVQSIFKDVKNMTWPSGMEENAKLSAPYQID